MGYSGNMYAQATEVITSQGDLRRGDSSGNPERLAIGANTYVLSSNGTTESWTAPAGGGKIALVGSTVLTSDENEITVTIDPPIATSEVAYLMGVYSLNKTAAATAQPALLRVNQISDGSYDFDTAIITAGAETITSNTGESGWRVANSDIDGECFGIFYLSLNLVTDAIQMLSEASSDIATQWQGGYNTTAAQTTYSEVELSIGSGSFVDKSRLDVYRCNL